MLTGDGAVAGETLRMGDASPSVKVPPGMVLPDEDVKDSKKINNQKVKKQKRMRSSMKPKRKRGCKRVTHTASFNAHSVTEGLQNNIAGSPVYILTTRQWAAQ